MQCLRQPKKKKSFNAVFKTANNIKKSFNAVFMTAYNIKKEF